MLWLCATLLCSTTAKLSFPLVYVSPCLYVRLSLYHVLSITTVSSMCKASCEPDIVCLWFFFSSAFSLWLCLHGSTNNPCTEQFLPQVEFFFFNFNTASGVMHLSLPVPANQSLPVSVICYNSNILTARLIYHDNQLFSYFKTELEVTVHLKKKRTSSCSRMLEKIRNKRKMFRSSAPNFIAENQIVE